MRIEYRYGAGNSDAVRKFASELVTLAPDVILASGTPSVGALQQVQLSLIYGDLSGFPPTILTSGTRDLFLSNTVRASQAASGRHCR